MKYTLTNSNLNVDLNSCSNKVTLDLNKFTNSNISNINNFSISGGNEEFILQIIGSMDIDKKITIDSKGSVILGNKIGNSSVLRIGDGIEIKAGSFTQHKKSKILPKNNAKIYCSIEGTDVSKSIVINGNNKLAYLSLIGNVSNVKSIISGAKNQITNAKNQVTKGTSVTHGLGIDYTGDLKFARNYSVGCKNRFALIANKIEINSELKSDGDMYLESRTGAIINTGSIISNYGLVQLMAARDISCNPDQQNDKSPIIYGYKGINFESKGNVILTGSKVTSMGLYQVSADNYFTRTKMWQETSQSKESGWFYKTKRNNIKTQSLVTDVVCANFNIKADKKIEINGGSLKAIACSGHVYNYLHSATGKIYVNGLKYRIIDDEFISSVWGREVTSNAGFVHQPFHLSMENSNLSTVGEKIYFCNVNTEAKKAKFKAKQEVQFENKPNKCTAESRGHGLNFDLAQMSVGVKAALGGATSTDLSAGGIITVDEMDIETGLFAVRNGYAINVEEKSKVKCNNMDVNGVAATTNPTGASFGIGFGLLDAGNPKVSLAGGFENNTEHHKSELNFGKHLELNVINELSVANVKIHADHLCGYVNKLNARTDLDQKFELNIGGATNFNTSFSGEYSQKNKKKFNSGKSSLTAKTIADDFQISSAETEAMNLPDNIKAHIGGHYGQNNQQEESDSSFYLGASIDNKVATIRFGTDEKNQVSLGGSRAGNLKLGGKIKGYGGYFGFNENKKINSVTVNCNDSYGYVQVASNSEKQNTYTVGHGNFYAATATDSNSCNVGYGVSSINIQLNRPNDDEDYEIESKPEFKHGAQTPKLDKKERAKNKVLLVGESKTEFVCSKLESEKFNISAELLDSQKSLELFDDFVENYVKYSEAQQKKTYASLVVVREILEMCPAVGSIFSSIEEYNKRDLANMIIGTENSYDPVMTKVNILTGLFGAISKLKHLGKIAKVAKQLNKVRKAVKGVNKAKKFVEEAIEILNRAAEEEKEKSNEEKLDSIVRAGAVRSRASAI